MGCLVRIFNRTTTDVLTSGEDLKRAEEMFPPVFVGLPISVRKGRWRFIGNIPVRDYPIPAFRATSATKPGTYKNWWIWDGQKDQFIGKLPTGLRSLELKCVWGDELLEDRIATGKNPFAGIR